MLLFSILMSGGYNLGGQLDVYSILKLRVNSAKNRKNAKFQSKIDVQVSTLVSTQHHNWAFQRPSSSLGHLFTQVVSRVTKTNQDSPRSKMGRSFRIWSPFCHPTKTELKCAFFIFFRKNQNFLKKGAFKAKIIARDMVKLCYKLCHCEVWNVSFH